MGVLSIQGAISEHIESVNNAFKEIDLCGNAIAVRKKSQISNIDALIIPGGESTTISKILVKTGMHDAIVKRVENNDLPIMGTCAGCVLLAKRILDGNNELNLLNIMDMEVQRNAFGRQKESFEKNICLNGISKNYHAVFIRAPIIKKIWGNYDILAKIDKKIIAARQDKFLAFSFHPELTDDLKLHKYFIEMFI